MEKKDQPIIGKGLWQQMNERSEPVKAPDTWEEWKKLIEDIFSRPHRQPPVMHLPAYDYPEMSDEEFRKLCEMKDVKFTGGREGCDRMLARCKRLGISVNGN